MDSAAHLILTILIFGWDPYAIMGCLLPDTLYWVAFIRTKGKGYRGSSIFSWGERLHSLFILPILGLLLYLMSYNSSFLIFTEAVFLHLITDLITHRTEGPRFFWPILDEYYPRGLVDWCKPAVIISYYLLLLTLAVFMRFFI